MAKGSELQEQHVVRALTRGQKNKRCFIEFGRKGGEEGRLKNERSSPVLPMPGEKSCHGFFMESNIFKQ
jgi:hypothetical protein